MAMLFSNTVDRTLERLRTAFIDTARGAREAVGAPIRPDLPDDGVPRFLRAGAITDHGTCREPERRKKYHQTTDHALLRNNT